MIKIAIRADGGPNIGLGHIQRCLALSSQLQKSGLGILFIIKRNEVVKEKIEQEGFEVIELKDNLNLEEDLGHTIEVIRNNKVDILITDSYGFDEKYLIETKKSVGLLVSIDDLAVIAFPSDIVINQNIYANELNYHSSIDKTKFLLGPKYALLREEFANLGKRKISPKIKNVLVTLGGSDRFNLTPKILNVLDTIEEDFNITAVIGHFFNNVPEIQNTVKKMSKKAELIYNSSQMTDLMLSSDLAITGGGTTLYELAATGTPAFAFCLADNQVKNVKGMAKTGTVIDMGWGNEWKAENLYKEINELINDYIPRKKMSKLGQKLVDGKGNQRVSDIILKEKEFREER